jgi:hypothetical protein
MEDVTKKAGKKVPKVLEHIPNIEQIIVIVAL